MIGFHLGAEESYLSSVCLADETSSIGGGVTVLGETETFYVRMNGYTGRACDGCGGRWREGVVGDGGRLLLHGECGKGSEGKNGMLGAKDSWVWTH